MILEKYDFDSLYNYFAEFLKHFSEQPEAADIIIIPIDVLTGQAVMLSTLDAESRIIVLQQLMRQELRQAFEKEEELKEVLCKLVESILNN